MLRQAAGMDLEELKGPFVDISLDVNEATAVPHPVHQVKYTTKKIWEVWIVQNVFVGNQSYINLKKRQNTKYWNWEFLFFIVIIIHKSLKLLFFLSS